MVGSFWVLWDVWKYKAITLSANPFSVSLGPQTHTHTRGRNGSSNRKRIDGERNVVSRGLDDIKFPTIWCIKRQNPSTGSASLAPHLTVLLCWSSFFALVSFWGIRKSPSLTLRFSRPYSAIYKHFFEVTPLKILHFLKESHRRYPRR